MVAGTWLEMSNRPETSLALLTLSYLRDRKQCERRTSAVAKTSLGSVQKTYGKS